MIDISTVLGFATGAGLIYFGIQEGNLLSVFLNWHGLLVVVGGTLAALFVHSPIHYVWASLKMIVLVFFKPRQTSVEEVTRALVDLAGQARTGGVLSMQLPPESQELAGGFLSEAVQIAKEQGESNFVRRVLEERISLGADHSREIVNVFQTMSVLSPMFGLLGTLIGIIQVLRELSNPDTVGTSMALAITSAFYGILLANLVFVPISGKIRLRNIEENRRKEMILEGVIEILNGAVPLTVLRRMESYQER